MCDVGRNQRDIKNKSNGIFFKKIPEEAKGFFRKVVVTTNGEGGEKREVRMRDVGEDAAMTTKLKF